MPREPRAYLHDIAHAAALISEFIAGLDYDAYQDRPMVRAAVERQFEIIGEALRQLAATDPSMAEQVTNHRRVIAFRNILAHGYAGVDDRLVWDMAATHLGDLRRDVDRLLGAG